MAPRTTATWAQLPFPPKDPAPSFPYRVLERVGQGAMGEVYRAEDLELGRIVAIKVIKPAFLAELSAPDVELVVQRFIQEARTAAALAHPGVPVMYRVAMHEHWPFIAMEWIEGQTLELLLSGGKQVPVANVARLGMQVLSVLSVAHQTGIIHRDIKPANLMLMRDGRIKVTDFGIARMSGSTAARTQAGFLLGTPQYASPEQLTGRTIDGRTDLYALAGVLYEALTGQPPFDAPSIYEMIAKIQTQTPIPPSHFNADISPDLDHVILTALAKDPSRRYTSAQEMMVALQPFLTYRTAQQTQTQTQTHIQRFATSVHSSIKNSAPVVICEGLTTAHVILNCVRQWPANPLGSHSTDLLLARLHERPLHTPAFCGAVIVSSVCLLVCEGIIHTVFDTATGQIGDDLIERLPPEIDAMLYAVPEYIDRHVISLLGSLLIPHEPRFANLDATLIDLPKFGDKLESEGFDGSLRFTRGAALGFALYRCGRCILRLFSRGWDANASAHWASWVSGPNTFVHVEDRVSRFPSITFQYQLSEMSLNIERPPEQAPSTIRTDTLSPSLAVQLIANFGSGRRSDSTLHALLEGDPARADARWLFSDVEVLFKQYGRSSRWPSLIQPLGKAIEVVLHHRLSPASEIPDIIDVATYNKERRLLHVLQRVAIGSRKNVTHFIQRAVLWKGTIPSAAEMGAVILIAPSFDEDALQGYFDELKAANKRSFWQRFDAFSHIEGYLRTGPRSGFHVLLVEETDGRRRPLMPQ